MADRSEDLLQRILNALEGRGSISGRSRAGGGAGGNNADRLDETLDQTAESMRTFLSVQKEYTKRQQAGSFVAGLFGKSTDAAQRNMGQLRQAISQHERALEALTEQGHTATSTQYKKVQADLKVLKSQEAMYGAQQTGAQMISNASGQIFHTFLNLGRIQAEYQANLLNIVSQGGSGFQMAAAALENAVNKMHAVQSTLSQIAISAGQSLGQLGGKFAPLAGLALGALGHAAQAAADAARTLAQAQIRIMAQEGDKLIKTHMQLTGTGVIFGNGMQGLIDATTGTKLRLEEMSAVVNENRETFSRLGIGMSGATKLIGGVAKILASTTGQFARADRQLLALGYSYQEQAELAAETAAMMSRGGRRVSEKQVAEATMEMAKNMRLVAEVAGEDMKEKRKTIRAEQEKFAINAALAKLQRDDPKRYKQFQDQLQGMSDAQRKAAYEVLTFNSVRDKDVALQIALNKGFKKTFEENQAALKNGTANTKQALSAEVKNSKETTDGYIAMGATVGKANMALGSFEGLSQAASKELDRSGKLINTSVEEAEKNIRELQGKGKEDPKGSKDPTVMLLQAVEKGAVAAKNLQEEVIKRLPKLAAALEQAYKDAMATLRGQGGGSGLPGWVDKLLPYLPIITAGLTAVALALQMFPGALSGTFQKLKEKIFGVPKELPGSGKLPSTGPEAEAPGGRQSRAERRRAERASRRSTPGKGKFPSTAALPSTPLTPGGGGGIPGGGGGSGSVGGMLGELADGLKKFGPALSSIGKGIGGALEGFLRGLAGGLTAFANPMVVAGSVGFGVAIAAVGAGIAGASWLLGKALPTLSKGLASFSVIDGKALVDVGLGVASLGAGLLVFGAGSAVGGAGNVIGNIADGLTNLFGGKDLITRLKEFSTLGPGLKTSGDGLLHASQGLYKFGGVFLGFTKMDIKPLDAIIEKLKALKEAAKPPEVSVLDSAKNLVTSALDRAASVVTPSTTPTTKTPATPSPAAKTPTTKTPATPSVTTQRTPTTAPAAPKEKPVARPTTPTTAGVPNKAALTAAEKSNVMETVAVNTKYANDLLINNQKNLESLVKAAINRLDSIVSATEATAGYGRKTANNTK
jgi:hypothetical protein